MYGTWAGGAVAATDSELVRLREENAALRAKMDAAQSQSAAEVWKLREENMSMRRCLAQSQGVVSEARGVKAGDRRATENGAVNGVMAKRGQSIPNKDSPDKGAVQATKGTHSVSTDRRTATDQGYEANAIGTRHSMPDPQARNVQKQGNLHVLKDSASKAAPRSDPNKQHSSWLEEVPHQNPKHQSQHDLGRHQHANENDKNNECTRQRKATPSECAVVQSTQPSGRLVYDGFDTKGPPLVRLPEQGMPIRCHVRDDVDSDDLDAKGVPLSRRQARGHSVDVDIHSLLMEPIFKPRNGRNSVTLPTGDDDRHWTKAIRSVSLSCGRMRTGQFSCFAGETSSLVFLFCGQMR